GETAGSGRAWASERAGLATRAGRSRAAAYGFPVAAAVARTDDHRPVSFAISPPARLGERTLTGADGAVATALTFLRSFRQAHGQREGTVCG
ncbi:MAG: hypothetical protein NZL87_02380, partial [Thermomicrobium sp.]|nr:hypothetical protein [Thermomicrobium sp.]